MVLRGWGGDKRPPPVLGTDWHYDGAGGSGRLRIIRESSGYRIRAVCRTDGYQNCRGWEANQKPKIQTDGAERK